MLTKNRNWLLQSQSSERSAPDFDKRLDAAIEQLRAVGCTVERIGHDAITVTAPEGKEDAVREILKGLTP